MTRSPRAFAGHLSYGQMALAQQVLRRSGTWDLMWLHDGEQLRGDFKECGYIALDRSQTGTLEFSTLKTMWGLLGRTPQVGSPCGFE